MIAVPAEEARVDADGRLLSAGARLAALNARAGGEIGAPIAVPSLAMLAHLAQTLRIPVSRLVIAADAEEDVELQVQARPENGSVALQVSGWTQRPRRASWLVAAPTPADPDPAAIGEWTWRTDGALRVSETRFGPDDATSQYESDVLGQPLTRLVRLIEDADGEMPILAALAARSSFSGQRAIRRDKPDAEFELSGEVLIDNNGGFAGFSGRARPVLPNGRDVADAPAGLGVSDLANRLGQVLRAPLDRIVARADTIRAQAEGPLRRDYADYAGDIGSAARHLLALVDDLADLNAVERPDFAVEGEPVDLADVARRAAGLLGVRAGDKQVRIDRPDTDETLMARGDFHRVLQILVNLLANAVRYTPEGGMIWLRTEQDGDTAVVIVADQGKGIAAADHERVFDKFERVDTSEAGGSGLGLYISRRLARAMGGDITLDSAPGQGARFILTLPAV